MKKIVNSTINGPSRVSYLCELLGLRKTELPVIGVRTIGYSRSGEERVDYFILTSEKLGFINVDSPKIDKFFQVILGSEELRYYGCNKISTDYQEVGQFHSYRPLTAKEKIDLQSRLN